MYGTAQAPQAPQNQRPQRPSLFTSVREQIENRIKNRLEIRRERIEKNRKKSTTVAPPINSAVVLPEVVGASNSSSSVVNSPQVEGTSATSSVIAESPIVAGTTNSYVDDNSEELSADVPDSTNE